MIPKVFQKKRRRGYACISMLASVVFVLCISFYAFPVFAEDEDTQDAKEPWFTSWVNLEHATGAYDDTTVGFIAAWNGNLSKDGIVFRADTLSVGVVEDGIGQELDLMTGYQYHFSAATVSGFAGADFQRQPDSSWGPVYSAGFKVAASVETDKEAPFSGSLDGTYSTILDTYWSRARAGYNLWSVVIGPEAVLQGNDSFRGERAGAFTEIPLESILRHSANIEVAGGYQWVRSFCKGAANCQTGAAGTVRDQGVYVSAGVDFSF